MESSASVTRAKKIPAKDTMRLESVRTVLGAAWLGGATVVLMIVVLQSLFGHYGERTQEAWGWLLPTMMPTLSMIVTVLGYTALEPRMTKTVVRKSFFILALGLSVLYFILIALTIVIQPFTGTEPVELMRISNLWLGPFQGLVAAALGVLFVSREQEKHPPQPNSCEFDRLNWPTSIV